MKVNCIQSSLYMSPSLIQKDKKDMCSIPFREKIYDIEAQKTPLDTLQAYSNVSFGYNCELKKLIKRGRIQVKYSFYGGKLNVKKLSIEHVIPRSKGGKSCQSNYVMCNKEQNWERGNNPLEGYLDWEAVGKYLDQFQGVRVGSFDGDKYIKEILSSINDALRTGR